MKVLTFNVWNYAPHWQHRRRRIADIISAHQPDIVCLQETRHDFRYERGAGQGEQLAYLTNYYPTSHVAQVYVPILRVAEGLTILTRFPPLQTFVRSLRQYPHLRRDENRRICLGVRVQCGGVEVDVYNTHFSLSPVAGIGNAEDVAAFTREQSGIMPTILTGDLNVEPGNDAIALLTHGPAHFVDCWAACRPQDPGYTYASHHPVRRIDYVLSRHISRIVRIDLVGGEVTGDEFPSDHLGIVAEFDM